MRFSGVHSKLEGAEDVSSSLSFDDLRKAYEDVYLLQHVCSASSGFSRVFNFSLHKGSVNETLLDRYAYLMNTSTSLNVEEFLRTVSYHKASLA